MDVSEPRTDQTEPLVSFYQHVLTAYHIFPAVKHRLADKARDYLGELLIAAQQAVVCYQKPTSVEEVRAYEPSLRAPALAFLLWAYQRGRTGDHDLLFEINRWSSYLWQQEENQELLPLVDTSVHTTEDLVCWFRCHERLLGAV